MSRRVARRSSATRRTAVPPGRRDGASGGSFASMFAKLAGASGRLEQSRRPMRKR